MGRVNSKLTDCVVADNLVLPAFIMTSTEEKELEANLVFFLKKRKKNPVEETGDLVIGGECL